MELEFRHLHTFQTIVQEGSFVRAAEKLNYSQATITLQIQQLEEIVGLQVFSRENKRRLQLTEAGRLLLTHSTHLRNHVDSLQQSMYELRTGESGHLRIGGIEPLVTQLFPDVLQAFFQDYPKVRVTVETRGTTGIHTLVSKGDVDLGLTTPPPFRSGLLFEPLFTEVLVALIPRDHPLNRADAIPIAAFRDIKVILTNPSCAYRELIERTFIEQGINLNVTLEMGSLTAITRLVQNGVGLAILPKAATRERSDGVVIKPIEQIDFQIPIGLVRKTELNPSVSVQSVEMFIHLLKESLSALA
jgi:DNA-binding transcriptional LysR family regulator